MKFTTAGFSAEDHSHHSRGIGRRVVDDPEGYVEIFVDTPMEDCQQHDAKGLYAKARAGIIKGFNGIDDPYEAPTDVEMVLDTVKYSTKESADQVMERLREEGYLG